MYFLVKLLSRLPLNVLYLISDGLYVTIYKIFGYRKRIVRSNIQKAFPKTDLKLRLKIEKDFYKGFCDFFVESIKAFTIDEKEIVKRVQFVNLAEIRNVMSSNNSFLMLAAHQFNWEWMQLSASLQFPKPMDYVYHPLHNQSTDHIMLNLRNRFGARPIKRREAARQILKRLPEGRGFALVADQFPASRDKKHWVSFLGIETAFFYSIDQLARIIDQPVLFYHLIRKKRGYYEVRMEIITLNPREEKEGAVVEKYAKAIENNVNDQPSGYLWSHKRWKKTRKDFM